MSQEQRLIEYLETHVGITQLEATTKLGTLRLAARVKDARNHGYKIHTNKIEVTKADGTTARVAQYRLER